MVLMKVFIAEDEEQLQEMPMPEVVDSTDPFLVSLNEQNLEPKQYAWQLVVQHQLNPQQTLAVAPVVQVVQQMYEGRSNQASYIADGKPAQPCRCLWLGAGGGDTHGCCGHCCNASAVRRHMWQQHPHMLLLAFLAWKLGPCINWVA